MTKFSFLSQPASKTNPVISNLPATRNVDESANVGSLLFTVSVTDPDAMDIHTYTLENVSPEDAGSKFNFVGTCECTSIWSC